MTERLRFLFICRYCESLGNCVAESAVIWSLLSQVDRHPWILLDSFYPFPIRLQIFSSSSFEIRFSPFFNNSTRPVEVILHFSCDFLAEFAVVVAYWTYHVSEEFSTVCWCTRCFTPIFFPFFIETDESSIKVLDDNSLDLRRNNLFLSANYMKLYDTYL